MKKHILIVGMAPGFVGGTETFVMKIYNGLEKEKYIFDVLLDVRDGKLAFEDEIVNRGGTVYRICYGLKTHPIKHFTALKKFFADHKEIVAVHANMTLIYDIDFMIAAKRAGVNIRIMHCHNTQYSDPNIARKYPFAYILDRFNRMRISRIATHLYACSNDAGKWMFGDKSYQVVPVTVNTIKYRFQEEKREYVRKKYQIENKIVIGFIGRTDYQKNPQFAVEVIEKLSKLTDKYHLIMVGKGEYDQQIDEMINDKGIGNCVTRIRYVEDSEFIPMFYALDYLIMPSRFEGFPGVLVEAQSAGIKCFASENITPDVNITGNITYCVDRVEDWIKKILMASPNENRAAYADKVKLLGYDDYDMAAKMQRVYEGEQVRW